MLEATNSEKRERDRKQQHGKILLCGRLAVVTTIHALHEVLNLDGGPLDLVFRAQDLIGVSQDLLSVAVFFFKKFNM